MFRPKNGPNGPTGHGNASLASANDGAAAADQYGYLQAAKCATDPRLLPNDGLFDDNDLNDYSLCQGPTTSHTGPEVFDFDDSGVTMGSPSYNSPGGVRRRGRGRRGGTNLGDRQLSISSLENDSTPASPSEPGPGKKRGSGSYFSNRNQIPIINVAIWSAWPAEAPKAEEAREWR
jgi:hypothetical protein